MPQYIQDHTQRVYKTSFQYTVPQNNFFGVQAQRNTPIRQASLSRSNNVSSSMVTKSGKIQGDLGGKFGRQNGFKNSLDLKENDPYEQNFNFVGQHNKIQHNLKQSAEFVSQYDPKNSYYNPLIVKRDRLDRDVSRQKTLPSVQTNQNSSETLKNSMNFRDSFSRQQYEQLSQKITLIQNLVKDNTNCLFDHKKKIQNLEEFYQHQVSKGQQNRKHSRSISTTSSAHASFKELSDIMNLIQETKNYQIKNSQEYRKMIEEFRSTILQFRDELNRTVKKQDLDNQLSRIRSAVSGNIANRLRKSSMDLCNSQSSSNKPKQIENIQKQILSVKSAIQRLEQNNTSFKADLLKINVRQKKAAEQAQLGLGQVARKLENLQKELTPFNFNQTAKGHKYKGTAICFKVSQQLQPYNFDQGPATGHQLHTTNPSSLGQYQQGMKQPVSKPVFKLTQKTYFIDKQGYLLDRDNLYLLNDRNQQIKLSDKQIEILRRLKVLQ